MSVDQSIDDDDDGVPWSADMDADGRLAEPLEKAIPGDFYSLLQLDVGADPDDVKKQYRQLQKWQGSGEGGRHVRVVHGSFAHARIYCVSSPHDALSRRQEVLSFILHILFLAVGTRRAHASFFLGANKHIHAHTS